MFNQFPVCSHGNKLYNKQRVCPTGRAKNIRGILVYHSRQCLCQLAVYPDKLNYHEQRWLERWNQRSMTL